MISTEDATAFLDYFCNGTAQTDHAVMVDAPWGAGKTYFVKAYLAAREEKARKETDFVGPPFLYASLFGVTSREEIHEQFFAQAYPILGSRAAKVIGTGLAGVLKKFTGFETDTENGGLAPLLRLEAKVLVFDDLERVAVPIADALGMINSFVEHGDFKVIIIANQKEIPAEQKRGYERQREKLIGRTLSIKANPRVVLDKLIGDMQSDSARQAIEAHAELVTRLFVASDTHNLRSLRAGVSEFERLVSAVDPKLSASPEALRRLLMQVLVADIEFRRGLTRPELDALLDVQISFLAKTSQTPEQLKASAIRAKYPEVDWHEPIVPVAVLADMLESGVLNVEAANSAIAIHPLIAEPAAVPSWLRFVEWSARSASTYAHDRADILDALAKHRIVEPGEICHVAGTAIWLESLAAPLFPDLEREMTAYIDAIEAAGTLEPNRTIFTGPFTDAWRGYMFSSLEDPQFQRIKAHLGAAVERRFSAKMKAAAPSLLAALRRPGDEGIALFDGDHDHGRFGGLAVLHHLDPTAIADLLLLDGQVNRALLSALQRRYEYWGTECELVKERPWLMTLQKELTARATGLGPPFQEFLHKAFGKAFGDILNLVDAIARRCRPTAKAKTTATKKRPLARSAPTKRRSP